MLSSLLSSPAPRDAGRSHAARPAWGAAPRSIGVGRRPTSQALPCMSPAKTRILLQTPCALLPFTSPASTHSPSMHRLEESTQREGRRCSRAGLSAAAKPGAAESLPDQRPIRAPRTSCRAPQALSTSLSCSNSPCPQGLGAAHISLHSQGAPWIIWAATKLQIGVMPVEVGGTCVHAACSQGWTHSTKHRLVGGDMAKTPQLHTWPQTWGERADTWVWPCRAAHGYGCWGMKQLPALPPMGSGLCMSFSVSAPSPGHSVSIG